MPREPIATGLAIVPVSPAVASSFDLSTAASAGLPPSCMLPGARRIVDQRDIPCCVSCAIAAAAESANPAWDALSPLFHYFAARTRTMGVAAEQASNLSFEDGYSALQDLGICLDRLHDRPMDADGMASLPAPAAWDDARGRRLPPASVFPPISRIEALGDGNRVRDWKRALLTGKPIVAGIDLPADYGKEMLRASATNGRLGLSHAVAVLGYRDSEQAFIVQDSRGPDWFHGGQWWMPFGFAESGFVYRAWAFRFR